MHEAIVEVFIVCALLKQQPTVIIMSVFIIARAQNYHLQLFPPNFIYLRIRIASIERRSLLRNNFEEEDECAELKTNSIGRFSSLTPRKNSSRQLNVHQETKSIIISQIIRNDSYNFSVANLWVLNVLFPFQVSRACGGKSSRRRRKVS